MINACWRSNRRRSRSRPQIQDYPTSRHFIAGASILADDRSCQANFYICRKNLASLIIERL